VEWRRDRTSPPRIWGAGLFSIAFALGACDCGGGAQPTSTSTYAASAGSVAAGCEHSCAITSDSGVVCWGGNGQGQLGIGRLSAHENVTRVPNIAGAAQITAGCFFTCALLQDAKVRCWGQGTSGQLGDGARQDRLLPVEPQDLHEVVQISAGDSHACAVEREGSVRCWGSNPHGQVGHRSGEGSALATPVAIITGAAMVASGERTSCAVLRSGEARCWGDNSSGALGSGSQLPGATEPAGTPQRVLGITSATAIATAGHQTAALLRDGTVRYWGISPLPGAPCEVRMIPGPSGVVQSYCTTPQPLPGVTGARAIGISNGINAVLLDDGRVLTWDGYASRPPTPIPEIVDAVDMAIGTNHACVRRRNGQVRCWGRRQTHREIGGGSPTHRAGPNDDFEIADVTVP
jgi:alpha-tubulin suppressor-like RCC1 family protein